MFDVTGDPATAAMVRDALLSVIEEELEAEDAPGSDEIADSVLDVLIHSADSMNVATVALVALHVFLVTWHSLARAFQAAISTLNQHADVLAELKEENKTDGSAGSYLAVLEGHSLKMKAFVKELQRTNTLSPIPWRRLTAACDVGAAHLEEGTVVCLAVPLLHNDPSQYENPEKFDMTRFSKERAEDKKNSGFCWLPYGTGSKTKGHRCASEKLQESIIKMFGVMAAGMQWKLEGSTWSIQ